MLNARPRPMSRGMWTFLRAGAFLAPLLSVASAADELRVALLVTHENGPESALVFATPGQPLPPSAAWLSHRPDAAVRGALLPDTEAAAVVADEAPGRDRSWGSTLFVVETGRPARPLCDRVAYAARPLVTGDGWIVVPRGEAGVERTGELRVDTLTVAEVDPGSGTVRTLFTTTGFAAFPAVLHGKDVVVYVVGPDRARLVAVDREDGHVRVLVPSLPPFARDFSVTPEGHVVFANRDALRRDLWTVESVDLASGEALRLHASRFAALAPHVWKDGTVTWNSRDPGSASEAAGALAPPEDTGLLEIVAASADGSRAAAHHLRPGAKALEAVVVDRLGRISSRIVPPVGARLEIVGLLP